MREPPRSGTDRGSLLGVPSLGLPGRGRGAGTGRQGQPCSPYASILISLFSAHHVGGDGLGISGLSRCLLDVWATIAHVLVLGTRRSSSVFLFSSSRLPGLAVGAGTCPSRNGIGQPAPAAGDLLLPSSYPFAFHTKGSSIGSSHILSSDHFPLILLGSRSQDCMLLPAFHTSRAVSRYICSHFP